VVIVCFVFFSQFFYNSFNLFLIVFSFFFFLIGRTSRLSGLDFHRRVSDMIVEEEEVENCQFVGAQTFIFESSFDFQRRIFSRRNHFFNIFFSFFRARPKKMSPKTDESHLRTQGRDKSRREKDRERERETRINKEGKRK